MEKVGETIGKSCSTKCLNSLMIHLLSVSSTNSYSNCFEKLDYFINVKYHFQLKKGLTYGNSRHNESLLNLTPELGRSVFQKGLALLPFVHLQCGLGWHNGISTGTNIFKSNTSHPHIITSSQLFLFRPTMHSRQKVLNTPVSWWEWCHWRTTLCAPYDSTTL